jgi:adenine-specific DNA-methyltransferase
MIDKETVQITEAKGRPMLHWVGKRPLDYVTAFPAQQVETFNPAGEQAEAQGLLFHGDNKDVLAWLLAHGYRGKVSLIYIDPPFDSGANYMRRVRLRGAKSLGQLEGEAYTLGEQIQYTDIWINDAYLQFMYERLQLLAELLAASGSLYLHCDPRKSHLLRCLLDEVLGANSFVSEIVWQSADAQSSANRYGPIHNTIFYYARPGNRIWNDVRTPLSKSTADTWYTHEEVTQTDIVNKLGVRIPQGTVRRYNMADLTARKPGGDTQYEWKGVRPPVGRYWAYSRENMEDFEKRGLIAYSASGRPYLKRYLDEVEGTPPQDLWTDISMLRGISRAENSGYPTEKPEELVDRIMRISSNPDDLVLDCFVGSGTTAAVAQRLGRRWIAADINKGAIQTTSKRLQAIVQEQIEAGAAPRQPGLPSFGEENNPPPPAALSFSVYRVNDYDLQVQHNEAVNLAVEHIGIQRTKTDAYFDGTLGTRLVKIVSFNHPLTLLDLQLLQDELKARPDEERDVVLVCLGKETAIDPWLADYNKRHPVNKIEVIELRTDQKYGKFFVHQPAQAQVSIERQGSQVLVKIEDFISPTIVERLEMDTPLFKAQIPDWRAMVDVVLIDTDYDGEVFDIALSDVPERKDDLVGGRYELPVTEGPTTVAVKIIDMLGEEVLVTAEV